MPVLLSAKATKMNTLAVELSLDSMMLAFVEGWTKGILCSESLSILLLIDIVIINSRKYLRHQRDSILQATACASYTLPWLFHVSFCSFWTWVEIF